jgi:hypothetical protein
MLYVDSVFNRALTDITIEGAEVPVNFKAT